MKKSTSFFFCFIILLAASGFAFYTGWSQFKVEPGNVGIIVSKTGGVKPEPITHDKFSWNWEFLLPTNATLMVFNPKPYTSSQKIEGVLPSGKEYAKLYNGAADFSYSFDFSITLKCSTEQIIELVKSNEISSQEDLEKHFEQNAQIIAAAVVNDVINEISEEKIQSVSSAETIIKLTAMNNCKNCELDSITLLQHVFPDMQMYKSAKTSYTEYIAKLEAAAEEAAAITAENTKRAAEEAAKQAQLEAEEKNRFATTIQKMESLGETLKKYPELSDVIKNSENVSKALQLIESME